MDMAYVKRIAKRIGKRIGRKRIGERIAKRIAIVKRATKGLECLLAWESEHGEVESAKCRGC